MKYFHIFIISITIFLFECNGNIINVPKSSSIRQHNHEEMDWWHNTVFYQIYPRSFQDSDDDGIGDINGITDKLRHLQEMGITATWLSPIFTSPMVDFGYDIQNYTEIAEIFGTLDDFKQLISEARRMDIKIILDFVPNHTSNQSAWFQSCLEGNQTYCDYYVWHDGAVGGGLPNNWLSVFGGPAWTWIEIRQQYYLHQFAPAQPDLNFRNPAVQEEMRQVLRYWISLGVSGFRVDAINHLFEAEDFADDIAGEDPNNYDLMDHINTKNLPESYETVFDWREYLEELQVELGTETILFMTEAYGSTEETIRWYGDGERKGSQMPFNFALIANINGESTPDDFKREIDEYLDAIPEGQFPNWVAGNHDRPRIGSRFSPERIDAMNMLVLTLPGIGVTYYGEEIGMVDFRDISWEDTKDPQACQKNESVYLEFTRDPVRTPFQWDNSVSAGFSNNPITWLPVHPNYETVNLHAQTEAERSHYKVYTDLIKLRSTEHVFMELACETKALNDNKVLAFQRSMSGDKTLFYTILNFDSEEQIVRLRDFRVTLNETVEITSVGSRYTIGQEINGQDIQLHPYEGIVIRAIGGANTITISLVLLTITFLRVFL